MRATAAAAGFVCFLLPAQHRSGGGSDPLSDWSGVDEPASRRDPSTTGNAPRRQCTMSDRPWRSSPSARCCCRPPSPSLTVLAVPVSAFSHPAAISVCSTRRQTSCSSDWIMQERRRCCTCCAMTRSNTETVANRHSADGRLVMLHCTAEAATHVCVTMPGLPFSSFQIIAHEPTRHPQNEELVIGNVRSDRGASTQHTAQRTIERAATAVQCGCSIEIVVG